MNIGTTCFLNIETVSNVTRGNISSNMAQIKKLKKFFFSLVIIWLFTPATAFAINPFYVHKSESVGEIFRHIVFNPFAWMMLPIILSYMLLPAILLGWFIHRKHIAYSFFIVCPILFLLPIIFNPKEKLSNILLVNMGIFLALVLFIVTSFFVATIINNFKEKKRNFSNKDYIPIVIIIAITLILMFLPIRSGHLVCKTPIVNKQFNCNYYLQQDRSWFVF